MAKQIAGNPIVADRFRSWLTQGEDGTLQRIAAQALAMRMADEVVSWDYQLVEKIETVSMTLERPCPHALESLKAIAMIRAVRRGVRMETVLRDALAVLSNSIRLAFVFGSTARGRQTEESDIDLMLIGDVKLKDLSVPLRHAERTLGRRISPVIYTFDSYRRKIQSGDPFLLDIYRREKIPIFRASESLSETELNDELRNMVAERLA